MPSSHYPVYVAPFLKVNGPLVTRPNSSVFSSGITSGTPFPSTRLPSFVAPPIIHKHRDINNYYKGVLTIRTISILEVIMHIVSHVLLREGLTDLTIIFLSLTITVARTISHLGLSYF